MVRLHYAALGAILLPAIWLAYLGYAADWQSGAFYERLGEAALSWRLAGLSATCYACAVEVHRGELLQAKYRAAPAAEEAALAKVVRARTIAARILLAAQRPYAALPFAESAYRADYRNTAAAALLWRARYAVGMTTEAKRELMLLGLDNPRPEILTALGELFLTEDKPAAALDFARRALEQSNKLAEPWLLLGRIYGNAGDRRNASRAAAKAWECAAGEPDLQQQAAWMYVQFYPDRSNWSVAGRGLDYWWQAVSRWVQDHCAFLALSAAYLIFVFFPGIARRVWKRAY